MMDIGMKKENPLKVRILPAPWRTWWAYMIYTLAILGFIVWFVRSQKQKLIFEQHKVAHEKSVSEKLRQVDKLKDVFLANTSHELRTPLNGIIGIAESIIDGAAGDVTNQMKSNLSMIVTSGRRLANLVDDILDFSQLKEQSLTLHKQAVDIYSLADVVLTVMHPLTAGKIELINDIDDEVRPIEGDEDRVQQILYNLIGNAIKFTKSGSVRVGCEVDGDWLRISVADTGIGIAEDQKASIFKSFDQGDGDTAGIYGGTGLGLAICQQLVELHGGHITVESTPGEGSVFSFTLPLFEGEVDMGSLNYPVSKIHILESKVEDGESISTQVLSGEEKFRVLVVDDEPINRKVLVNQLSLQNYLLVEAAGGEQALKVINEHEPPFDLVLLDIMMPGFSGYEVCRKIRETYPIHELPVIFLTAKNQVADLVESFEVGANDYLSKPVVKHELLSRVATHLQLLDVNRNLEERVKDRTGELEQKNEELHLAYKSLEEVSLTDQLTSLKNRRFLYAHMDADVALVLRHYKNKNSKKAIGIGDSQLLFFLLDMDHFKMINDTYGHAAGDMVLIQIKEIMLQVFRSSDFFVRWGGEEFLVVVRFMEPENAPKLAERLRKAMEDYPFDIGDGNIISKTCSIGFACFPFHPSMPELIDWTQVIDIADGCLLAAKKSQRNAWVGVYAHKQTEIKHLYEEISEQPQQLIESGALLLKTSIANKNDVKWK